MPKKSTQKALSITFTLPIALADSLGLCDGATHHVPRAVETDRYVRVWLRDVSEDDETIHFRVRRSDANG